MKITNKLVLGLYISYKTRVNKGISINNIYEAPTTGYMVGIKNFDNLKDMLKQELKQGEYYGTWKDIKTNTVYYDISKNIVDYKEAVDLAKSRKELAIFDLNIFDSIYI